MTQVSCMAAVERKEVLKGDAKGKANGVENIRVVGLVPICSAKLFR